jgi:hypothetical protein
VSRDGYISQSVWKALFDQADEVGVSLQQLSGLLFRVVTLDILEQRNPIPEMVKNAPECLTASVGSFPLRLFALSPA